MDQAAQKPLFSAKTIVNENCVILFTLIMLFFGKLPQKTDITKPKEENYGV